MGASAARVETFLGHAAELPCDVARRFGTTLFWLAGRAAAADPAYRRRKAVPIASLVPMALSTIGHFKFLHETLTPI
jgi:hypothetical protein